MPMPGRMSEAPWATRAERVPLRVRLRVACPVCRRVDAPPARAPVRREAPGRPPVVEAVRRAPPARDAPVFRVVPVRADVVALAPVRVELERVVRDRVAPERPGPEGAEAFEARAVVRLVERRAPPRVLVAPEAAARLPVRPPARDRAPPARAPAVREPLARAAPVRVPPVRVADLLLVLRAAAIRVSLLRWLAWEYGFGRWASGCGRARPLLAIVIACRRLALPEAEYHTKMRN